MSTLGSIDPYRKLSCIEPVGFMNLAFFKCYRDVDTKKYFIILKTDHFETGYRDWLKHCHLYFGKF